MDNFSSPDAPASNKISNIDPTIITLSQSQYTLYQSDIIEIHAPDGEHLESLGQKIRDDQAKESAYQLQSQICLLECLFLNITDSIELPVKASSGLVDVFYRMQELCSKHIE
ncbi:MAG: hypothetical protein V4660_18445 [Pseudomonadota bacterium]